MYQALTLLTELFYHFHTKHMKQSKDSNPSLHFPRVLKRNKDTEGTTDKTPSSQLFLLSLIMKVSQELGIVGFHSGRKCVSAPV